MEAPKLRIASAGKRLFAFLIDGSLALLLIKTITLWNEPRHWDLLVPQPLSTEAWLWYYTALFVLICSKDLLTGRSFGKFLLGIATRDLANIQASPSFPKRLLRNFPLLLFPLEGVVLLSNKHLRRLGDRWLGTVVVEQPGTVRPLMRFVLGNTAYLGFFFAAWFVHPHNLKKSAMYDRALADLKHDPELEQQVGRWQDSEEFDLQMAPSGSAALTQFSMKVIGDKTEKIVTLQLRRVELPTPDWEVVSKVWSEAD